MVEVTWLTLWRSQIFQPEAAEGEGVAHHLSQSLQEVLCDDLEELTVLLPKLWADLRGGATW